MVEMEDRGELLASLRVYLEDLWETGMEELPFAPVGEARMAPQPHEASGVPQDASAPHPPPEMQGAPLHRQGASGARLLFVEDGAGFEGESGDLLVKIVQAMGFRREEVSILSFDAGGAEDELPPRAALLAAIRAEAPEVVVALGEVTAQILLESRESISALRGTFSLLEGRALMPTLHPEALLQNAALKREVWADMQQVMKRLGMKRPA